jgi:hypothetical protein
MSANGKRDALPDLGTLPSRNAEICRRYKAGETMEHVGESYGISRERVRQILGRAGVRSRRGGTKGHRRVEYVEWRCASCGKTEMRPPFRARARGRFCDHKCRSIFLVGTPGMMLAALAALAEHLGRTPSQADIHRDRDTPSHMTYVHHFGSLSAAQRAAGLTPNKVGGLGHDYRERNA